MTETIEALQKVADDWQRRANQVRSRAAQAKSLELTSRWHWPARLAAELCEKTDEPEVLAGFTTSG